MKRKAISIILALALCVGLAAPSLAAETIPSVSIAIPGIDTYVDEVTENKADASGLTFKLENAPSQYYFSEDEYGASYLFAVPEGCKVTPSLQMSCGVYYADGGGMGNTGPENPLSFDNVSSNYWSDDFGYSELAFSFGFSNKDDKYIVVYFYYLSPEGELDLNAPGNEYMKADYEYDGIIDGEDGIDKGGFNGMPSYGMGTILTAPDKFGFKLRQTSELDVAATATEKPSSWAEAQVNAAIAAKLVPAALQSKYTIATTRAEFCALAVAMYETITGKEITDRSTFTDTKDINVEKAAAIGVVSGVGDNKFSPDTELTREQAAVMLARLAEAIGKPLAKQTATFTDNASVSSWAVDAVGQMQATGIMGGVGNNTFAPKNPYTREQSIVTILRLYDVLK